MSALLGVRPLTPVSASRSVPPSALAAAVRAGARVVDVRTSAQRLSQGVLPGALAVSADRLAGAVLPDSPTRLAWADGFDVRWIVVAADDAQAAQAAQWLRALGLRAASHVAGGYPALAEAGLATSLLPMSAHNLAEIASFLAH